MSLDMIKFMGATLRDASMSLSWGQNGTSTLSLSLVEEAGDLFTAPSLGTPVSFAAGALSFRGLLQKYTKDKSVDGGEIYSVTLIDPRVILQKCQVILDGYSGSVGGTRNLINIYGYWESQGFGASLANPGGMPYTQIRNGLLTLINSGVMSTYGGPLYYRGVSYGIDISEVPIPPSGYRVPNTGAISLLELISEICDDAGYEFYVTLVNNVITVKTRSHINAPPLGTITSFIEANENSNINRSSQGVEIRDAEATRFLVGGQQHIINTNGTIHSYWGNDINGNPVLGQVGYNVFVNCSGTIIASYRNDYADINAAPVADIIGSLTYRINEMELRCTVSHEAWADYISNHRPDVAAVLNITGGADWAGAFNPGNPAARTNIDASRIFNEEEYSRQERLYEYVKSFADNFYGKKWAVAIPSVSVKVDPDSLEKTFSHEPTDGGYVAEGAGLLGLNSVDEDTFKLQDGRFGPFVKFSGLTSGINFTTMPSSDSVFQTESYTLSGEVNAAYVKCNLDQGRIIFYNNQPYVVISLPGVIQEKYTDLYGDLNYFVGLLQGSNVSSTRRQEIADSLGVNIGVTAYGGLNIFQTTLDCNAAQTLAIGRAQGQNLVQRRTFGTMPEAIAPKRLAPAYAAIPLKSNILTYGPWSVQGPAGSKVRYQQDTSLTPWNYGGYNEMNLAAQAKLTAAATQAEVVESGSIDQAGLPAFNLGDVMVENGPNITNINISYRPRSGATTSYRFESYTPRRGNLFNNGLPENIRRLGQNSANLRREVRARQQENILRGNAVADAQRGAFNNQRERIRALRNQTPHPVFASHVYDDENGLTHIGTSLLSRDEAESVFMLSTTNENWQSHAVMDVAGVFIPVSTWGSGGMTPMSGNTNGSSLDIYGPTLHNFQSWGTNADKTVEWLTVGTANSGMFTGRSRVADQIADGADVRFMANRAPMVLCGWGWTISGTVLGKDAYPTSYQQKPSEWKAGPLDALWDEYRQCWTSHGFVRGVLQTNATLSGDMVVYLMDKYGEVRSDWPLRVSCYYNPNGILSGYKVGCNYDAYANKWWITSADCS